MGVENQTAMVAERAKAHCPRCDGERTCDVRGSHNEVWRSGDHEFWVDGQIDHRLLECRGCEMVFYWQSSSNSENADYEYNRETDEDEIVYHNTITTYPLPEKHTARPDWTWTLDRTDMTLANLLKEVYTAHDSNSLILGSIGLRVILDRAAQKLGIEPALVMAEKLKRLVQDGWIGEIEADTLEVVVNAGNAAAHRGWAPNTAEFEVLLQTIEQFIYRALVTGRHILEFAPNIPSKQRPLGDKRLITPPPPPDTAT